MILLDTHVLSWLSSGARALGRRARGVVERAWDRGEVATSTIVFWEAALLQDRGRIDLPDDASAWRDSLVDDGLIEIPVNGAIAIRAGKLSGLHGDPGDRILVATAQEGHTLVTADARLLDWPGEMSRIDALS